MSTKTNSLPRPLPVTGSIPAAGLMFYGAARERSYRLAKEGAIITKSIGQRRKVALLHATAKMLGVDV